MRMKKLFRQSCVAAGTLLLVSCAATAVMQTWKAPGYVGGPVRKVAVLAVDERQLVRQGFENRFVNALRAQGQEAFVTHELLSLGEIEENKTAAAARVRQEGASAVMIIRLVDSATRSREVAATPALFAPVATVPTAVESDGWYVYYNVAFMDKGTVWGSDQQTVYLETVLFDLTGNRRLWSCLTETVLKEGMDKLVEADLLVTQVLAALRKDGMVR